MKEADNNVSSIKRDLARPPEDRVRQHYVESGYRWIENLQVAVSDEVLAKAKELERPDYWDKQAEIDKKIDFDLACRANAAIKADSMDPHVINDKEGIVFSPLNTMIDAYLKDDMETAHAAAKEFEAGMVELGVCDAALAHQIARDAVRDLNNQHTAGSSGTYIHY